MRSFRGIPLLESLFGDGEEMPYVCTACGEPLAVEYHHCPECGSYSVDQRRWSVE